MPELFLKGGILMYPLLLCSILVLALILERGWYFLRNRHKGGFYPRFLSLIKQADYEQGRLCLAACREPLAEFLGAAVAAAGKSREDMERLLVLKGDQVLAGFHRRLHLLELISNVAPLLGLLGTVLGMVQVFQEIAALAVAATPSQLAAGIWEALLTTVFGLVIAIPALVAHHLLVNRLKALAFTLQQAGEELLNLLYAEKGEPATGSLKLSREHASLSPGV